mmetsp:Transcript_45283/g.96753  ORF Transcript_45283/g.96753 Transcript_45283/m.96753 type:complete len:387 (+) Transcript_45283:3-1163(+)
MAEHFRNAATPPLPTGLSPKGGRRGDCGASVDTATTSRDDSPFIRSERRRPRTGDSDEPCSPEAGAQGFGGGFDKQEDEDELLRAGGDELLNWANDVLRKAQEEKAQHRRSTVRAAAPATQWAPETPRRQAPAPESSGGGRGYGATTAARPSSPGADARQRRAQEMRDEMRRLMEEAETECQRLTVEEAERRRRLAADQESWRGRLNSATEEMRNNFAQWGFDASAGPYAGSTDARRRYSGEARAGGTGSGTAPRGGSMPPRQQEAPIAQSALLTSRRRAQAAEEHEAAWAKLETALESGTGCIRFADIPWPEGTCITGVSPGDSASVAKRRLAGALRRWHPDKWRRILDRVPEAEQARVMERVKTIAQRLLEEKAKLTGLGGILH